MSLDNRDFDNDFINSSWDNMHAILDQEMPVHKNNQSHFVWFMSLILLLGIFGSWMIVKYNFQEVIDVDTTITDTNQFAGLAQETKSIDPVKANKSEAVVNQTQKLQNSKIVKVTPIPAITTTKDKQQNNVSSKRPSKANQSNKYQSNKVIAKTQETTSIAIQRLEDYPTLTKTTSVSVLEPVILKPASQIIEVSAISKNTNTKVFTEVNSIIQIDDIPSLAMASLDYDNEQKLKAPNSKFILLNNRKAKKETIISLGIVSSMSTNTHFAGLGLSLNVDFPLGNKFSLFTGTDIVYNNKFQFKTENPKKTEPQMTPPGPPAPVVKTNHYDNYNNGIDIVTPLGIAYKVSKNLSINAGVNHRYTISNNEIVNNPLRKNVSKYNRQFISPIAGLSLQIGSAANISLSYEQGLKSFVNSDISVDETAKNSYICLGTRININ